jgi:hypothetical protein
MSSRVTIGGKIYSIECSTDFETGNLSDEFDNKSDDELNKYLEQRIDIESIDRNCLTFWYEPRFAYLILSRLVCSIYSIPDPTADVERQFSVSEMIISSRRTRLNPEQANNGMFLFSVKEMSDWSLFFYS